MSTSDRIGFSVIAAFLIIGPAVLIGMSLPYTETWRGYLGVAAGGVWIVYWCWALAEIWSGWLDMQRRKR
jgi:hypothetical protein